MDDAFRALRELLRHVRAAGVKLGADIEHLNTFRSDGGANPLLPAPPHDIQSIDTLLDGFEGIVPADKGFIDAYKLLSCWSVKKFLLSLLRVKNMKTNLPDPLLQFCKRIRKRIETVGSHLTRRFKIDQIRVHSLAFSTPSDS